MYDHRKALERLEELGSAGWARSAASAADEAKEGASPTPTLVRGTTPSLVGGVELGGEGGVPLAALAPLAPPVPVPVPALNQADSYPVVIDELNTPKAGKSVTLLPPVKPPPPVDTPPDVSKSTKEKRKGSLLE